MLFLKEDNGGRGVFHLVFFESSIGTIFGPTYIFHASSLRMNSVLCGFLVD